MAARSVKRKFIFQSYNFKSKNILFFIADGIILEQEGFTAPTLKSLCDQRADVARGVNQWCATMKKTSLGKKVSLFPFTAFNPKRSFTLVKKLECVLVSRTYVQH